MKCSLCKQNFDHTVPVGLIWTECKRHTRTMDDLNLRSHVCIDCLTEILMDSQWEVGWEKRSHFIYRDILPVIAEMNDDRDKKILNAIVSAGGSSLSDMCIICGKDNALLLSGDETDLLKNLNAKYKEKYIPEMEREAFGNLICERCIAKREVSMIRRMTLEKLPLHINKGFISEKGKKELKLRLSNGK